MLVGMAAFGWLSVRAFPLFEPGAERQTLGADVLIMVAIVIVWAGTMLALLRPPPGVLARVSRTTDGGPVVVWTLGADLRIWNVILVPFCGFFGSMFFFPVDYGPDDNSTPPTATQIVAIVTLVAIIIATIWVISRSLLHGVELTESHLIAYGYFQTRRFERDTLTRASPATMNIFVAEVFALLRSYPDRTVRLTLKNGDQVALLASSGSGACQGAEVINAWLNAPRDKAQMTTTQ